MNPGQARGTAAAEPASQTGALAGSEAGKARRKPEPENPEWPLAAPVENAAGNLTLGLVRVSGEDLPQRPTSSPPKQMGIPDAAPQALKGAEDAAPGPRLPVGGHASKDGREPSPLAFAARLTEAGPVAQGPGVESKTVSTPAATPDHRRPVLEQTHLSPAPPAGDAAGEDSPESLELPSLRKPAESSAGRREASSGGEASPETIPPAVPAPAPRSLTPATAAPEPGAFAGPAAPARKEQPPIPSLMAEAESRSLTAADAQRSARPPVAHDIAVRITGDKNEGVQVQIAERGGKIHVEVRAADQNLARSLRGDLGSLVSRLEQSGYHAETFAPAGSSFSSPTTSRNSGNASQDASPGSPGGGHGGAGQSREGDRRNQQTPPEWFEELKHSLGSDSEPGKEEFAWHHPFNP